MDNLFTKMQLTDKIMITPDNSINNLDLHIQYKLKKKVGNKCLKDGYVLKNSIQIIKRSIGKINSSFFNGSISYNIIYSATICNPKKGAFLTVQYVDHNKMGILAIKEGTPLNIVIPTKLHSDKNLFKQIDQKLQNNNEIDIKIQVIGKRFEKNDSEIFVIGKLVNLL